MKCPKLRRLLADGGPAALAGNQKAEDHLVDCSECYAVLEAMAEVDRLLPALESHDVADEVVEHLLARPELKTRPGAGAAGAAGRFVRVHTLQWLGGVIDRARQTRLRWGLVAVPAVVVVGLISVMTMKSANAPVVPQEIYVVKQVKAKPSIAETEEQKTLYNLEGTERISGGMADTFGPTGADEAGGGGDLGQHTKPPSDSPINPRPAAKNVPIPDAIAEEPQSVTVGGVEGSAQRIAGFVADENLVLGVPDAPPPPENVAGFGALSDQDQRDAGRETKVASFTNTAKTPSDADLEDDKDDGLRLEEQHRKLKKELDLGIAGGKLDSSWVSGWADSQQAAGEDDALAAARRYLAAREQIDGLSFREARGYWANTYVPGDRTLHRLKARLDRAAGTGATGALHDGSRQISQPFDAPDGAALAVYLHGDRRGVETRERMLVQIGLKGTPRRSGMRPAMNVGLVLDLRGEVTPTEATSIRALLTAFAASAELGDRFSLTVAGRPGGTILRPGDLRHGPLTVAMKELFDDDTAGAALTLDQAVAAALATVRADEDPNAPLGSSALIVVTAQRLGGLTGRLATMAHQSAVEGVPWSAIGIGQGVDLAELDALVLAGQGNRRLMTSAADAEALIDRELAAVSRVVARAVRLRIRLAPGVQLINVIGSERLGERRSQQVRDAEQAIDQRLSRNLGIQADRGLDEEGIQIVIPSFYADDAHVVLLDVVVPGPGPVADVTVRYKDLVHMKNGVTRAHLRAGRAGSANGPLERNVLANLVATEVASSLDRAADAVAGGDVAAARSILRDTLDLVSGITRLVEGLEQDFEADIEMLAGYLQALSALSVDDAAQLQTAADSLRYAGRLKVLPPPVGDDQPAP